MQTSPYSRGIVPLRTASHTRLRYARTPARPRRLLDSRDHDLEQADAGGSGERPRPPLPLLSFPGRPLPVSYPALVLPSMTPPQTLLQG
jgi:hypothetical protein